MGIRTPQRVASGSLEVTNPQQFFDAFVQGIGSAKAFGFGMLLIKPLHPALEPEGPV